MILWAGKPSPVISELPKTQGKPMKKAILTALFLAYCSVSFAVDKDGTGGKQTENMFCKIFKVACTRVDQDGVSGKVDQDGVGGKSNEGAGEHPPSHIDPESSFRTFGANRAQSGGLENNF